MAEQGRAGLIHQTRMRLGRSPGGVPESPPEAAVAATTRASAVVNLAIYSRGRRVASPASLSDVFSERASRPGAVAWIGLYRPTPEQVERSWAAGT